MHTDQLQQIFLQFNQSSSFKSFSELKSGHINDTFVINTIDNSNYILQKVNHNVFKNVPGLISNKVYVSNHLKEKTNHLPKIEQLRRVLTFLPTKTGDYYYLDAEGNYWNAMIFIDGSFTYQTVKNEHIAFEGGKLIGEFLNQTSDLDPNFLIEVIPDFHNMFFRFKQFNEALKTASKERLKMADSCIDSIFKLEEEMLIIENLKKSGKIKTRVTHNDTKISNVLFDANNKGLCVIDTDTVMPGVVHYDFGDAIRSICNTAAEDEADLEKVNFNFNFYKAYAKGFLKKVENVLSPLEIKYLPLAAKTMTFIMALRFLTDFLNGDVYYKTSFENQNLIRSKNQLKLIESMTASFKENGIEVV